MTRLTMLLPPLAPSPLPPLPLRSPLLASPPLVLRLPRLPLLRLLSFFSVPWLLFPVPSLLSPLSLSPLAWLPLVLLWALAPVLSHAPGAVGARLPQGGRRR